MAKTVRRFQFQPAIEGLDRRIAPSGVGSTAPSNDGTASQDTTSMGPTQPGGGGSSGSPKVPGSPPSK